MNKRVFLKTSSALAGGAVLSGLPGCNPGKHGEHLKNWAGNLTYGTSNVHYPSTVSEVQEIVRKSGKIKALGSQHSFNRIADSSEAQLSTKNLNKIVSLDTAGKKVTVEGGVRYGELAPYLQEHGFALHNLASLPHITVAGACATATPGSGVQNGNLSTAVSAIELVNSAGDLVSLGREKDADLFNAAVVGLGAFGIVTRLTLDLQPAFNMTQVVYRNLPMQELENNFEAVVSAGYSVSLFTDWKNKNINEVWVKSRVQNGSDAPAPASLFGAAAATRNMHPIETESAENCTEQMGVPGAWFERMPHFKMGFKPSAGKELQGEYFIPIENAYAAIMAMEKLHAQITPHLFISEIRTIHADDFWMSPCYRQTCVALHTTWKQETEAVMKLLPLVEEQLAPFNPKPHWAKLFTIPHPCSGPVIRNSQNSGSLYRNLIPPESSRTSSCKRTS